MRLDLSLSSDRGTVPVRFAGFCGHGYFEMQPPNGCLFPVRSGQMSFGSGF